MARAFPTDALEQAKNVLDVWKRINPNLALGDLTPAALTADLDQAGQVQTEMNTLEAQLAELRNRRDTLHTAVWDKVKRVRAGVKGIYGDDSSEYEMVGGTRKSERKKPVRKARTRAAP